MENVSALMGFSFLFIQPVIYLDPPKFALKTVEKFGFLLGDYKLENDGISTLLKLLPATHLLPSAPLDSLSLTGKIL